MSIYTYRVFASFMFAYISNGNPSLAYPKSEGRRCARAIPLYRRAARPEASASCGCASILLYLGPRDTTTPLRGPPDLYSRAGRRIPSANARSVWDSVLGLQVGVSICRRTESRKNVPVSEYVYRGGVNVASNFNLSWL